MCPECTRRFLVWEKGKIIHLGRTICSHEDRKKRGREVILIDWEEWHDNVSNFDENSLDTVYFSISRYQSDTNLRAYSICWAHINEEKPSSQKFQQQRGRKIFRWSKNSKVQDCQVNFEHRFCHCMIHNQFCIWTCNGHERVIYQIPFAKVTRSNYRNSMVST